MISLLIPTRGRPQNIDRLMRSSMFTAYGPPLEYVFYVDEDDLQSLDCLEYWSSWLTVKVVSGPRICLSEMWNKCYEVSMKDILMYCSDDLIFRTEGWDFIVQDSFDQSQDKIQLVYGRDGIHDQGLATHGFVHNNWVKTLGYFLPPYFTSDYVDNWMTDIAAHIGRLVFKPDLYFEHMHFSVGKAEIDQTTKDRLERAKQSDPGNIYTAKAGEREEAATKLLKFIYESQSLHHNVQSADLAEKVS